MKALLYDPVNNVTFYLWWIRQSDGSDIPFPYMKSELIERKGLGNAVRKIGFFAPDMLQVHAKTDVVSKQDSELMLAALYLTQTEFTPLQLQVRRPDASWFNYDSVNCRFLIMSQYGSPGISMNTRQVLGVVGGVFSNSKIIADMQLILLPVATS